MSEFNVPFTEIANNIKCYSAEDVEAFERYVSDVIAALQAKNEALNSFIERQAKSWNDELAAALQERNELQAENERLKDANRVLRNQRNCQCCKNSGYVGVNKRCHLTSHDEEWCRNNNFELWETR